MVDLRELALALPEVQEKLSWRVHPTFRVRDRIIAILSEDERSARIKSTHEAQQAMIASDPATFSFPPYVGRHGWIGVDLARIDPEELGELLEDAWRMTAPRKMVRAFEERAI